jgi:hypothetical protein
MLISSAVATPLSIPYVPWRRGICVNRQHEGLGLTRSGVCKVETPTRRNHCRENAPVSSTGASKLGHPASASGARRRAASRLQTTVLRPTLVASRPNSPRSAASAQPKTRFGKPSPSLVKPWGQAGLKPLSSLTPNIVEPAHVMNAGRQRHFASDSVVRTQLPHGS